jgi:hypothetical protein
MTGIEIKVTYLIENDSMSDKEYEEQEEKEFIITEQMIYDLVMENDVRIKHMVDDIDIMDIKTI